MGKHWHMDNTEVEMTDTLAHVNIKRALKLAIRYFASRKALTKDAGLGGGGIESNIILGDLAGPDGGASTSPEETTGLDYESIDSPERTYASYAERIENIDTFLATVLAWKFHGTRLAASDAPENGHAHTGGAGEGARISPENISAPVGAVGDATTLAEHVANQDIHVLGAGVVGGTNMYSRFASEDEIAAKWTVLSGSATAGTAPDGRVAARLVPGTRLRLAGSTAEWHDWVRIVSEFAFESGGSDARLEIHVRAGTGDETHPVFMLCGTGPSAICELAEFTGTLTEINDQYSVGELAAIESFVVCRHSVKGPYLRQWLDAGDGSVLQTAYLQTAPAGGYIELFVSGDSACWMGGFCAQHYTCDDITGMTDKLARMPVSADGRHSGIHHAKGADPVDVGNLADATGRMISVAQKGMLVNPTSGNIHPHPASAIDLENTVGDPTVADLDTLEEHMEDTTIHDPSSMPAACWPMHVSVVDDLAQDYVDYAELTAGTGGAWAARADHYHVIPYWMADIDNTGVGNDQAVANAHFCADAEFDVSGSVQPLPRIMPVTRVPIISVDGSIRLNRYMPVYSMYTPPGPGRPWESVTPHYRMRMRVYANTMFLTASFWVHPYGMNVSIVQRTDAGAVELYRYQASTTVPHAEAVDVTLAQGYNDFYVYAYGVGRNGVCSLSLSWITEEGWLTSLFTPALSNSTVNGGVYFVPSIGEDDTWWETDLGVLSAPNYGVFS